MSEPIYDEDIVNLGYLKRIISNTEDGIYENVSRHYASRPQPPYNKGDTWIDGDVIYTCISSRQIGNYVDSDWVTESGATEKAENKNKTYLTRPSNYSPGDMWILQSDNDHKAGKKGEILISTAGRKDYDEDDWINMLGYGSIASINEVAESLNNAINRIGNIEADIEDGVIVTFYQDSVPEGKHLGDLWYVTGEIESYIKGKIYRYDGTNWILLDDPEIQKAFDEANEARIVADGKIQSFYSDTEPTKDMGVGDLWIDLANNNQLYRYNGTKWVAVYDTRVNDLVVNVDTVTERVATIETDLGEIDLKVEENIIKINNANQGVDNLTTTEGTATGKNIHIEDSAEEPLVDIVVKGETKQEGEPSPDYPSEIENVDNVEINAVGKNLLNVFSGEWVAYYSVKQADGSIKANLQDNYYSMLRTTANKWKEYFLNNAGKTLTFSVKESFPDYAVGIVIMGERTSTTLGYQSIEHTKGERSVSLKIADDFTSISSIELRYFRKIPVEKFTDTTSVISELQLEEGSEATDYEPYKSQTEYFPLSEGQKLYEGSYLADDGVHNTRTQVVFTGNEDWAFTSTDNQIKTKRFSAKISPPNPDMKIDSQKNALCTHFANVNDATKDTESIYYAPLDSLTYIALRISVDKVTTVEQFKAYLAEQYSNNTPVIVEYELAEEEIIPYTEEQQEAWEKIKTLHTYKNITNISSTADLDIVYVRDNGLADTYETKSNANQKYKETTEKFAETKMTTDGIKDTVSSIQTTTANNYTELTNKFNDYAPKSDVVTIQKSVEKIQTDTYTKTEINTKLMDGSVTKVSTTAGTFDENGLTIEKTDAKTKGNFNEKGIKVMDATSSSAEELLFAGYDEDLGETIVRTKNINVEKYLTKCNIAREEAYTNPTLGGKGIGVFVL